MFSGVALLWLHFVSVSMVSLKMKVKLHFEILNLREVGEFHWVKPDESLFRVLLVACKKKLSAKSSCRRYSTGQLKLALLIVVK